MITNIQTPAARNSDPLSSHDAAAVMNKSGKRSTHVAILAEFVAQHPGHSSAELANMLTDIHPELNRHEVARRLADGKGIVFCQGPQRRCVQTQRLCITWWPVGYSAKAVA